VCCLTYGGLGWFRVRHQGLDLSASADAATVQYCYRCHCQPARHCFGRKGVCQCCVNDCCSRASLLRHPSVPALCLVSATNSAVVNIHRALLQNPNPRPWAARPGLPGTIRCASCPQRSAHCTCTDQQLPGSAQTHHTCMKTAQCVWALSCASIIIIIIITACPPMVSVPP
jgi:hypothetical protein